MRPSLRGTLIKLVVAVSPLTAAGCLVFDGERQPDAGVDSRLPTSDCGGWRTFRVLVEEPPPIELAALVDACETDPATCIQLCNEVLRRSVIDSNTNVTATQCDVTHSPTGHDVAIGYYGSCGAEGRRPAGLARGRKPRAGIAGTHLARSAWYEAASVYAFVSLARELARFGAPKTLRDAAKRAAIDEVHHARLMGDLARARGATPPKVEIEDPGLRSLESIAIENVTEGIVGETWAALIAFWQAAHATDPTMRATYARIAEDELRHAELSIEVDAWARTKLRPAARKRVDAARTRALAKLAKGVKTTQPAALVAELGMPDAAAMQKLFANARARVWA
ncbi:MAG: ferritin-like domain-containing protein [Deltaproteobacteria bacterium]|nr:ferritin-like domain-containing protein [Deltaproteobacteria bacterium]